MGHHIPWDLFAKFIRGETSRPEIIELEHWRDSSQLNRAIYDELIEDKNIQKAILSGRWENPSHDWQRLLTRIKIPAQQVKLSQRLIKLAAGIAALLILLLGFFVVLQYLQIKRIKSVDGYTYIYSPRGQKTSLILPDHSKVWLNSESSIKYPATFNQDTREVYLDGEAFFEVTRNPARSFLVNTNELKVKVYGTSFNIKAFSKEKFIETTLIEGRLSIIPMTSEGKAGGEIYLEPREKCIYKKATRDIITDSYQNSDRDLQEGQRALAEQKSASAKPSIIIEKNTDHEQEELWKEGKLIFKNESFEELAVRLERWFDVKIHFENEIIKSYKFTGIFEEETINQAMEALRISSKKSYQYKIVFRDIYLSIK